MGIWECNIHENTGIGFACKHIVRDMKLKFYNYRCHNINFKWKNSELDEMENFYMVVCDYCFRSKNLNYEMELPNYDIILEEMSKYVGLSTECYVCVQEFITKCNSKEKES